MVVVRLIRKIAILLLVLGFMMQGVSAVTYIASMNSQPPSGFKCDEFNDEYNYAPSTPGLISPKTIQWSGYPDTGNGYGIEWSGGTFGSQSGTIVTNSSISWIWAYGNCPGNPWGAPGGSWITVTDAAIHVASGSSCMDGVFNTYLVEIYGNTLINTTNNSYNFDIIEGLDYSIYFDTTNEWHNFTANGSDETWDPTCQLNQVDGKIRAYDYEGAYNVTVDLLVWENIGPYLQEATTQTDSNGNFSFSGINNNTYFIRYSGVYGESSTINFSVAWSDYTLKIPFYLPSSPFSDYRYLGYTSYNANVTNASSGAPLTDVIVESRNLENTPQNVDYTTANGTTGNNTFWTSNIYFTLPEYNVSRTCMGDAWHVNDTCDIALSVSEIEEKEKFLANNTVIYCNGWCYLAMSNSSGESLDYIDSNLTYDYVQSAFNGSGQRFVSHRTGIDFYGDYVVGQKYGYAVYFNSPEVIVRAVPSKPTITLYQGWNMAGNLQATPRNLTTLMSSIGGNAYVSQYYSGSWTDTGSQDVPGGKSFMVYVNSSTSWSG